MYETLFLKRTLFLKTHHLKYYWPLKVKETPIVDL